jgi:nitroimidazol reductase NimA-like FMN-containing flavoprotein (pyridoxamine 5'-phosphate oxidase superfamily)
MIFHKKFEAPDHAVARLVTDAPIVRLVTVGDDGTPHVGIFPFLYGDGWLEVHLARGDEQLADMAARPRVTMEIDEIFGHIPSHWSGPEATNADVYYRAAVYEGDATLDAGEGAGAGHLERLLERYQPEGGYDLIADTPEYRKYMSMLTVVHVGVLRRRTKFKLGQQESAVAQSAIHDNLRKRGRPEDLRAIAEATSILGQPR